MLMLPLSKAYLHKQIFQKPKLCHVGIHLSTLAEYPQMSTPVPGLNSNFLGFLHHFLLAKLATSSIRVDVLTKYFRLLVAVVGS